MKTTKLFLMAFFAMMLCAGVSSCGNDDDAADGEVTNGGGKEKGHEYVDLGLPSGTLWATCNIGAPIPEYSGDYFAWGETDTKNVYNADTYKWCTESNVFTKYCIYPKDGGTVDNRLVLESADDAAHKKWGGKWHIPTVEQWKELMACCECIETKQNGTKGVLVIRNDKQIFLPVTGYKDGHDIIEKDYCNYWTSSMQEDSRNRVYCISGHDEKPLSINYGRSIRYDGLAIRAVCSK